MWEFPRREGGAPIKFSSIKSRIIGTHRRTPKFGTPQWPFSLSLQPLYTRTRYSLLVGKKDYKKGRLCAQSQASGAGCQRPPFSAALRVELMVTISVPRRRIGSSWMGGWERRGIEMSLKSKDGYTRIMQGMYMDHCLNS